MSVKSVSGGTPKPLPTSRPNALFSSTKAARTPKCNEPMAERFVVNGPMVLFPMGIIFR